MVLERVVGALPEPDQRDVGTLLTGHVSDLVDVQLAGDHGVSERHDDDCEPLEALGALVRDQDAEVLRFAIGHARHLPGSGRLGPLRC